MKHNIIEAIKIIISIVLVCIATGLLFGYSILTASEEIFQEENIINTIKNIDIVELIGEEKKQEIYDILEKTEIPTEYIDAMLEDEQLKEKIGEYVVSSMNYLGSLEEAPALDATEVTNLLITTFDRVVGEAESYGIEVDSYISEEKQEVIHEKIEYYVPEIIEEIPEIQTVVEEKLNESSEYQEFETKMNQFKEFMNIVNKIYEYKLVLLLATIIPFGIIIIMKWKKFKFVKWFIFPVLFMSIGLKLVTYILPSIIDKVLTGNLSKMESIISPSIDVIISNMNNLAVTYFEISVAILLIQVGITIYKKTQESGE